MSKTNLVAPNNKREFITEMGKMLVEEHGKKQYYTPEEVKKTSEKRSWTDYIDPLEFLDPVEAIVDFSSWAMSVFSSHIEFDRYHLEIGEAHVYAELKTEMLQGMSFSSPAEAVEIPEVDIDASWLDFGDVFDGIFSFLDPF